MAHKTNEQVIAGVREYGFFALSTKEACVFSDTLKDFAPETIEDALASLVQQGKPKSLKCNELKSECLAIEPASGLTKSDDKRFNRAPDSYRAKMREMWKKRQVQKKEPKMERTAAAMVSNMTYALTEARRIQSKPAPTPREVIAAAVRAAENSVMHGSINDNEYQTIIAELREEYGKYRGEPAPDVPANIATHLPKTEINQIQDAQAT